MQHRAGVLTALVVSSSVRRVALYRSVWVCEGYKKFEYVEDNRTHFLRSLFFVIASTMFGFASGL